MRESLNLLGISALGGSTNDPARQSLKEFTRRVFPGYHNAPHLELIDAALEDVERGKLTRLLIECPPRHGKSDKASVHFPGYYLGRNPDKRVIIASYSSDLANRFSRRARNIVQSPTYPFPYRTAGDLSQVQRWDIEAHRGGLIAAGVGGSITGEGANLFIIDDPIKNSEEADSERVRENVWEWYQSTAFTRLEPGGAMIVIMTRWHEDDLIGRLLREDEERHEWTRIRLPAFAEEGDPLGRRVGEPLWPERYSKKDLERIRETVGPRYWGAMFQQRPSAAEGEIIKRRWVNFWHYTGIPLPPVMVKTADGLIEKQPVPLPPYQDRHIQTWDMAFKENEDNSFVVGQVWSQVGARLFLRDQIRDHYDFPATIRAVEQMNRRWPDAFQKFVEDKANGPAVIATLREKIPGLIAVTPQGSKVSRVNAISWAWEAGNIFLPHPDIAPWVETFLEELASFPNGQFDDQVDAMSQAVSKTLGNASRRLDLAFGKSMRWTTTNANGPVQSDQTFVPIPLRRMA